MWVTEYETTKMKMSVVPDEREEYENGTSLNAIKMVLCVINHDAVKTFVKWKLAVRAEASSLNALPRWGRIRPQESAVLK